MMQSKTMVKLMVLAILIAILSIYAPFYIFSEFLFQAQFLLVFLATFGLLSFFAYTMMTITSTFEQLSKTERQGPLPNFPSFTSGVSLRQFFTFGEQLSQFIRIRLKAQDKLIEDYNHTNDELRLHIDINKKFLTFAQQSINLGSEDSIHVNIQNEILNIIESFDASSFYITDTCGDLLRLDSNVGFSDDTFLLKSVPTEDFFGPLHSDESSIKVFEGMTYAQITHFIANANRQDEKFDLIELPIYIDKNLYGVFYFYNTNPTQTFSPKLRLLFKEYVPQAINAITNKILIKKTVFLSKYDSLTGLYNRSYFEQYFDDYNKHALRYKEHYSIVLIDLNRLKTINDQFGHVAGDRALQEFATLFKSKIRETDILARFGGDEFIAIFHNSDFNQTKERLKAIHSEFAHHQIRYGSFSIPIRFSYGIAASPDESMILNILVKLADERMYKLKEMLHKKEQNDFDF